MDISPLDTQPEDRELVEKIFAAVKEAAYGHSDKIYVGPEMYCRIMREPYFTCTAAGPPSRPFGAKLIIVYPDSLIAGGI